MGKHCSFAAFLAFCRPPHLSPGPAAAAEESPRETRLGPLSEPLFAAFSRDSARDGRFSRPFSGHFCGFPLPHPQIGRREAPPAVFGPQRPPSEISCLPKSRATGETSTFEGISQAFYAQMGCFRRPFSRILRLFAGRPTCHLGWQRPLRNPRGKHAWGRSLSRFLRPFPGISRETGGF